LNNLLILIYFYGFVIMAKDPKIDTHEIGAFYKAMKDVTPIKQRQRVQPKTVAKPKKFIPKETTPEMVLQFGFDDAEPKEQVEADTHLSYKHSSISNKILRKLMKGQYNLDAKLDLHGMTVDEARIEMDLFLQQALAHHARAVLIIHGKGHQHTVPILKNKVNHWLRTVSAVLAFCSAAPFHGGSGATYVLLKSIIEESDDE
jgi:DNA-nicking Smr family endonuclease